MAFSPKISIIIPAYNASATIRRLIASLQSQSLKDFEAIIINDGSIDDTASIVHEYADTDKRFKLISISNSGVSHARNVGIDNASAEYCTFIDADDYLLPSALHTFFSDDDMPGEYMVCQSIYMEDKDSHLRSDLFIYDKDLLVNENQNANFISQTHFLSNGYCFAKMYAMALLRREDIRFDEKLHIHEDHLFCFEYLTKCKGIKIKSDGGYIYQTGNGESLSFAVKPTYNLVTTSQLFLTYFQTLFAAYDITEDYRKKLLTDYVGSRILMEVGNAYQAQGNHPTRYTYKRYLAIRRRWGKNFKKYYAAPTKKAYLLKMVFLYCTCAYHQIQKHNIMR